MMSRDWMGANGDNYDENKARYMQEIEQQTFKKKKDDEGWWPAFPLEEKKPQPSVQNQEVRFKNLLDLMQLDEPTLRHMANVSIYESGGSCLGNMRTSRGDDCWDKLELCRLIIRLGKLP